MGYCTQLLYPIIMTEQQIEMCIRDSPETEMIAEKLTALMNL